MTKNIYLFLLIPLFVCINSFYAMHNNDIKTSEFHKKIQKTLDDISKKENNRIKMTELINAKMIPIIESINAKQHNSSKENK